MRATVISGLFGLAASITLTVLSVYRWFDPLQPLMIGAVAVFLPSVLLVVALDEEARPPHFVPLVLAQGVLVAAIFGIAVPLLWTVSNMRVAALEMFPSQRAIERALDDENREVQLSACGMMFEPSLGYRPAAAGAALLERPGLAPDCLSAVDQLDAAASATRILASTWHDRLLSGDAGQCQTLEAFDSLMVEEAQRTSMILDCALQAEARDVRDCCSGYLAARYAGGTIDETLRKGASMLDDLDTETALLAAAFDEESVVKKLGKVPAQLGLQETAVRAMSSDLACSAVVDGSARADTASMMQWVFDERTECLGKELANSRAPETIDSCRIFLDISYDARQSALDDALCEAHKRARRAVLADAQRVRSDADHGGIADEIDLGRTHINRNSLSTENWAELVESGTFQELTDEERALLGRNMRRDAERKGSLERASDKGFENAEAMQREGARERMKKEMSDPTRDVFTDTEKATGVSIQELQKAVEENGGELPDELRQKLGAP